MFFFFCTDLLVTVIIIIILLRFNHLFRKRREVGQCKKLKMCNFFYCINKYYNFYWICDCNTSLLFTKNLSIFEVEFQVNFLSLWLIENIKISILEILIE